MRTFDRNVQKALVDLNVTGGSSSGGYEYTYLGDAEESGDDVAIGAGGVGSHFVRFPIAAGSVHRIKIRLYVSVAATDFNSLWYSVFGYTTGDVIVSGRSIVNLISDFTTCKSQAVYNSDGEGENILAGSSTGAGEAFWDFEGLLDNTNGADCDIEVGFNKAGAGTGTFRKGSFYALEDITTA